MDIRNYFFDWNLVKNRTQKVEIQVVVLEAKLNMALCCLLHSVSGWISLQNIAGILDFKSWPGSQK